MRTMLPVLKRGLLHWDRKALPVEYARERFERVQALVAASGDDAWIVYGDVERHGHLTYASQFMPRTRGGAVMVPARGEPAILAAISSRDLPPARTLTWIEDIRPYSSAAKAVIQWLEERGLLAGRIGTVGIHSSMAQSDWAAIGAALAAGTVTDRTGKMERLRAAKDAVEVQALERSAVAVAKALDKAVDHLRPGTTMRALCAAIDRELRLAEAEDVRILAATGPASGTGLAVPDDTVIESGTPVMIFVRAQVHRYWAEGARTFVLGECSDALRDLAERAEAALDAMEAAARPGVRADAIALAADAALGEDLGAVARTYGYGNGIGLDAEETPSVSPASAQTLADDAVLATRIVVHAGGIGIAAGRTLCVGQAGARELATAPILVEVGC